MGSSSNGRAVFESGAPVSDAIDDGSPNSLIGVRAERGAALRGVAVGGFDEAALRPSEDVADGKDPVELELGEAVERDSLAELEVICNELVALRRLHRVPLSGGPKSPTGERQWQGRCRWFPRARSKETAELGRVGLFHRCPIVVPEQTWNGCGTGRLTGGSQIARVSGARPAGGRRGSRAPPSF